MLVQAGNAVDQTIKSLAEHMEAGDILIDGGNEWYLNSIRRSEELAPKGILYVGMGISGGEEGARLGPSLMVISSDITCAFSFHFIYLHPEVLSVRRFLSVGHLHYSLPNVHSLEAQKRPMIYWNPFCPLAPPKLMTEPAFATWVPSEAAIM